MRILIFHGYLLEGTGSNVYTARLAAALVRQGHEIHLLSQDRHPEHQPFADRAGDWDDAELHVRELRPRAARAGDAATGSCTLYRPAIGALLPVYVADRYEGVEARTFAACSDAEIERYVAANVAAVEDVLELAAPELALANHLVMGPLILARGLAGADVPYAVKIHGSALEYTVRPQPERFLAAAREGLAPARTVLAGSRHTAMSLWETIGDPQLPARTRLGPPGVDVESFGPREPERAAAGVRALAARLAGQADGEPHREGASEVEDSESSVFSRDIREAARAVGKLASGGDGPLVVYVGKLIVSKGVDLLAAAWPLVLEQVPGARLLVVGFGAYRQGLEQLLAALRAGDLEQAAGLARAGRALEDPAAPELPLRHLLAFLEGLQGERRTRYLAAGAELAESVLFSGRLEHDELLDLLPACEALVCPSTFPEAFGMVAAEAAACGVLPICADHSGLAEVSGALAGAVPEQAAAWLSFPVDDRAVQALAERIVGWLRAGPRLRRRTRDGLVATVRERWSWDGVARSVVTAAQHGPQGLPEP